MGRWEELMYDLPTDNRKIDWYPKCKGCIFAEDDGAGTGYRNGSCEIYPHPDRKPPGLDDGRIDCPAFTKE